MDEVCMGLWDRIKNPHKHTCGFLVLYLYYSMTEMKYDTSFQVYNCRYIIYDSWIEKFKTNEIIMN